MNASHLFSIPALLAALAALGFANAAQAQLVATPTAISFERMDQTHQIGLSYNGQSLRADQIRGVSVYINQNTYNYFFEIKKLEGAITLRPTDRVEVGVQKLIIHTSHGTVTVDVSTPLDKDADSDFSKAAAQGMTVEDYRHTLGLYTPAPREEVTLTIPARYYTGQTLQVTMDKTPGRIYTWRINGEVVAQGEDAHVLNHTFQQAGAKTIEYAETVNGKTVAATTVTTAVVDLPQ